MKTKSKRSTQAEGDRFVKQKQGQARQQAGLCSCFYIIYIICAIDSKENN